MAQGGKDGSRAASIVLKYFAMTYNPETRLRLARVIQYMMGWTEEQLVAFWQSEHVGTVYQGGKLTVEEGQSYCVDEKTQSLVSGDCRVDRMGASTGDWQVPAGPGRVQPRTSPNATRDVAAFARRIQEQGLDGLAQWLPTGRIDYREYGVQNYAASWLLRLVAPYYNVYVANGIDYDSKSRAWIGLGDITFGTHRYMLVPFSTDEHAMFLYFDTVDKMYTLYDSNGFKGVERDYYELLRVTFPDYVLEIPACITYGTQARAELPYCTTFSALTLLLTMASKRSPIEVDTMIQASIPSKELLASFILRYDAFLRVLANGNTNNPMRAQPLAMTDDTNGNETNIHYGTTPNHTLDFRHAVRRYHEGEFWTVYDLGYIPASAKSEQELAYRRERGIADFVETTVFVNGMTWGVPYIILYENNNLPKLVADQVAALLPNVDLTAPLHEPRHKIDWSTRMLTIHGTRSRHREPSTREKAHIMAKRRDQQANAWKSELLVHPLVPKDWYSLINTDGPKQFEVPLTGNRYIDETAQRLMMIIENRYDNFCETGFALAMALAQTDKITREVYDAWKRKAYRIYIFVPPPPREVYVLPRLEDLTDADESIPQHVMDRWFERVRNRWWMHASARRFIQLSYRRLYEGERTDEWEKVYRDMYGLGLYSLIFDAPWIRNKLVLKTIYNGRV